MAENKHYYGNNLDILLVTIAELLKGKRIDYPGINVTLRSAPRASSQSSREDQLPGLPSVSKE